MDTCSTAPITSYEIELDYVNDNLQYTIVVKNISNSTTCILMSEYFTGHPIEGITYDATIYAVNERGHSDAGVTRIESGNSCNSTHVHCRAGKFLSLETLYSFVCW